MKYIYEIEIVFPFLEFELRGHKVLFEDMKNDKYLQQISFTGIPFMILGKKRYDCTHGVDRGISTKKKYKEKKQKKVYCFYFEIVKIQNCKRISNVNKLYTFVFIQTFQIDEDHYFGKSRFHAQDSKKLNCPASIIIQDIVTFPSFKVSFQNNCNENPTL